jgi:hypothetical protein
VAEISTKELILSPPSYLPTLCLLLVENTNSLAFFSFPVPINDGLSLLSTFFSFQYVCVCVCVLAAVALQMFWQSCRKLVRLAFLSNSCVCVCGCEQGKRCERVTSNNVTHICT